MSDHNPNAFIFPIFLLCCITVIADIAGVAIYPAIPEIKKYFSSSPAMVQQVVTAYTLAAGISQIFVGPLTDRYGRKPILLAAISIYASASVLIALAPSIQILVIGRALEGLGASAMFVIPKAIARDTHDTLATTKIVGILIISIACAGTLGPPAFGVAIDLLGWRSVFTILAIGATILIVWTVLFLRETAPGLRLVGSNIWNKIAPFDLFRSRLFLGNTLILAFSSASYFIFLSFFPLVFKDSARFGASAIGLTIGVLSGFFILGAGLSAWAVRKFGNHLALRNSLLLAAFFGIVQIISTRLWNFSYFSFLIPTCFAAFSFGIINPITISGAISIRPEVAGSASGISTAVTMIVSSASIYGVSLLFDLSSTVFTLSIAVSAILSLLSLPLLDGSSPSVKLLDRAAVNR